jgi:hypothetical protein
MFSLDQAIEEWRRQMIAGGVKLPEALQELESHLREDIERRIGLGTRAESAFTSAAQELGSPPALQNEFAKTAGEKRRHIICQAAAIALVVFLLATILSCFIFLPLASAASHRYSQWLGLSPAWPRGAYLTFALRLLLGISLGFEIPVILLTLVRLGVLDCRSLSTARKYVIILNLILAALLTTPELITQVIMFIPLQLLYELTIAIARYWERVKGARPNHGRSQVSHGFRSC